MSEDIPEYLYKYITFEQFVDLVETEELYLTNITCWEDCYEGHEIDKFREYMLKDKKVNHGDKKLETLNQVKKKCYYAQSWTKASDESDAMWRIYSQQKTGVRIKIKTSDIIDCLWSLLDLHGNEYVELRCGDIMYDEPIDYEKYRVDVSNSSGSSLRGYTGIPFIFGKRKAFIHEEEYRFSIKLNWCEMCKEAFEVAKDGEILNELLKYDYPPIIRYSMPNKLIQEVILDPRATHFEQTFIRYCENRGLKKNGTVFEKSKLYELTKV